MVANLVHLVWHRRGDRISVVCSGEYHQEQPMDQEGLIFTPSIIMTTVAQRVTCPHCIRVCGTKL